MNDHNAILATPEGLVGQVLADRYQVQKLLGDGGMGSVYLAEHVALRKRVAIKVLHQELCRDQTQVDRFLQEARAASMIGHENIVDIVDFGPVPGGSVFFAMEFLEGEDLADLLRREGRLGWARAKGLMLQILRALAAAHAKGIIHRDLKPANCFLVKRSDGRDFVKLLDFGIAKVTDPESGDGGGLTRTGAVFGTAKYMAPEQACGEVADNRTDIYAAAICLYEFMTGTVPYDGDNFMRVLSQHLTEPLTPPTTKAPDANISPAVEAVIVKALSKRREDRYQSMEEFAAAIESIGPDGNLAGAVYDGPMAVGHGQAQPNAGSTMWLPDARPPSHPPEEPRGGTLLLDPNDAGAVDLEFGTVKLDGPHGWGDQGGGARPVSAPPASAPRAMPLGGPGTNPPGNAGLATTPPMPDTSPATAAPGGGDYTMFATETRSTGKFVALLVGGAIVAIGGGGLAAWLLLGGDDPTEHPKDAVVEAQPAKEPEPKVEEPKPEEPEVEPAGEGGLEIPDNEPEPQIEEPKVEEPEVEEPEVEEPKVEEPKPPTNKKKKKGGSRPRPPKSNEPKAALSSSDTKAGFNKAAGAVKSCGGALPNMTVTVQAMVNVDGSVLSTRVTGGSATANVKNCAAKAVKKNAKFAKTTKLQSVSFTFKF